jgi:polysaccharide export outer membrane protein
VVVRPDGKIAMPLLKDITVAGMTPAQAEAMITQKLSPIIHDAEVTVVVTAINSKKVYVLGAVRKEGPIAYTYRMTALEAISEAGGLTEYAKRKKIYILRTENGQTTRLPFNYDQVIRGEKMEQNIQLLPGDTIVVSQ